MREGDTFVPNTNEYAKSINGKMNLRKVFECVGHNISNGFLHLRQAAVTVTRMDNGIGIHIRLLSCQWIVFLGHKIKKMEDKL